MKRNVWKVRKNRIYALLIAAAVILSAGFMGILCSETAWAAGEKVYFGSESYEWTIGTSNPIGTYAEANGALESVEYTVEYDPEMLQYGDGGDLISAGSVKVASDNPSENPYKLLIAFTPQVAGHTEISITDATVTEEGGSPVSVKDESVSIDIPIPTGCRLDGISVDGNELSGFDTDKTEYTYTLTEYAEEVEIATEPDTGVEISDTKLSEGENVISILVENASGQQARYQVTVINPENPDAHAAEAEMYFGSESYLWDIDTSNQIGIYAEADKELEAVEYTIEYDPDMLEYNSDDGEVIEDGLIHFEATDISEDPYKILLSFTPLVAGHTRIIIRDAKVIEEGGEPVSLNSQPVLINIPIPTGCHLDGITVNGTELPNFDTETVFYNYTLDEYAEEVEITAEPDTGVEISDTTHLVEGGNIISILVENSNGQQARYRVDVINPEKEEESVSEEDAAVEEVAADEEVTAAEETTITEETTDEEGESFLIRVSRLSTNFRNFTRKHSILFIVIVVAIIFVIFWGGVYLRNLRRHRKRTEEWKKRNEAKLEERQWERTVQEAKGGEDKPLDIVVSGITMDFKLERDEPTSIKETVIRTLKRDRVVENFRALDNISFAVGAGEVVGIIGTNGSGKSTLLKIISGAIIPTKGKVTVDRDKIQLLTLGTGFDHELTGRENIYLNGAIIGYTKEFIDEKFDEIVRFAELEDFIDEKVRNYSSGMVSRLGFAIATVRDTPEILILDEVLSVGDIFFRKKSEARIQEMIHGGSTVLIVSHSMGVIRKNCDKVIWIEKGEMRMIGDPKEVCKAYENMENSEAVE